jgi:hypothetical protein
MVLSFKGGECERGNRRRRNKKNSIYSVFSLFFDHLRDQWSAVGSRQSAVASENPKFSGTCARQLETAGTFNLLHIVAVFTQNIE